MLITTTFLRDAFSHLTSQTGKHWSSTRVPSTSSFTNNRRDYSTYDADGNLLSGSFPDSYSYNSAGEIKTVQAVYDTMNQVFDGDGRRVKTSETTQSNGQSSTQVTYYITSSVLGGRVLTEMDANGGKQRTFIYAGNDVLAWQMVLLGAELVKWEHRDPSNLASGGDCREVLNTIRAKSRENVRRGLVSLRSRRDDAERLLPPPKDSIRQSYTYKRICQASGCSLVANRGKTDRQKAQLYTSPANQRVRGISYDNYSPLFASFFSCYRGGDSSGVWK